MLTTAPMRPEHILDGLRLCRAAGWNQTARDWRQFLDMTPHGARVAISEGHVVGTAATIRYADAFAWIGMVLVDPAARGRGIGTRLFHEAVELLSDMPAARLDATPAGYPLYLKQGFAEEYRVHRMTRPAVGRRPAAGSIRPMRGEDVRRVVAMDVRAFGAAREAMLHWMLDGAPELAWVAGDGAHLRGFVLGRRGHAFDHIGPVVAGNLEDAVALTAGALAVTSRPVILDATPHVPGWREWLRREGFDDQRELIRMTRGAAPSTDLERQFAILGPEFG